MFFLAAFVFLSASSLSACRPLATSKGAGESSSGAVRILIHEAPINLHPRFALDATSQFVDALIFRALTRVNSNLEVRSDLAQSWAEHRHGTVWEFQMRKNQPVTAARMKACLENYREPAPSGESPAAFKTLFANIRSISANSRSLVLKLKEPDPFLPKTLAMVRYFEEIPASPTQGQTLPCLVRNPTAPIVGMGSYRPQTWNPAPEGSLTLLPRNPGPKLKFLFAPDENTMLMKLLRGDADAGWDVFPLSKVEWLKAHETGQFDFLEKAGSQVSYLAYNFRNPFLAKNSVREAIAHAIQREDIVRNTVGGALAGSLVPTSLKDGLKTDWSSSAYDPALAEKLLDEAGLPRNRNGVRFTLTFKTTPLRESIELATMLQKMLARVGVQLRVEPVEPAVFFSSIRKGSFDLYTSRWLGVTDGTVLIRALRSDLTGPRSGYRNSRIDELLNRAVREIDSEKRSLLFQEVQRIAARELPYLPLWFWNNTLVLRKGATGIRSEDLSISGALEPLQEIQFK